MMAIILPKSVANCQQSGKDWERKLIWPLTRDGKVVIVPTKRHTPGHVSVIAVDGDLSYFMAGDLTYTEQALLERAIDGVSPNPAQALSTLDRILTYATSKPTVYLPSHDPDSKKRLNTASTIQPSMLIHPGAVGEETPILSCPRSVL